MNNNIQPYYIMAASCTGGQDGAQTAFCRMRSEARSNTDNPQGLSIDSYMAFSIVAACLLLVLFGISIYKKKIKK